MAQVGTASGAALHARDGEVLIHRDHWGIPHIFGNSMRAVAFGSGYAQAEDHLDAMLRLFLKARGELSRLEGERALAQDLMQRVLLTAEIVDRTWESVPRASKEFYQAFADGINRYLETHPNEKAAWYWHVQARDVAIYLRFTVLRSEFGVAIEELRGGGIDGPDGSNAWAIAGTRSASGHAMLVAGPHLPWKGDLQWYESHLKCPEFDMAGASFFGIPMPSLGHNGEIAWTATNNAADTTDLYLERTDPQNPERYLDSDGQWKTMERRSFRFDVRQPDGTTKAVERSALYTRRGPYIAMPNGNRYSVAMARWKDLPDPLTGAIRRAEARDLNAFRAALAEYPMDKWHLVYADRAGNIYIVGNGVFPRRDPKYNWRKPVPGWEADAQWKGIIPFNELPQFENPASGLIVQCNNSVYSSANPPPLDPAKYPPYMAPRSTVVAADTRAGRVYRLFSSKQKIAWEDHYSAARDVHTLLAEPLVKILLRSLEPDAADADLKEIQSILRSWDYVADLGNRAIPILNHWVRLARQRKLNPRKATPAQVRAVLQQAAAEMRTLYGKVSVPMSSVQFIARGGKEYPAPGVGGAAGLLNPFAGLFLSGATSYRHGKWYSNQGSSWVMVLAFDSPLKVFSITPLGQSEHPDSPHHADQTQLFSKRELKPFAFTDAEVRKVSEKSYSLKL